MKGKKISIILIISILCSFNFVSASEEVNSFKTSNFGMEGIKLTVADFNNTMTGPTEKRISTAQSKSLNYVDIDVRDVQIVKDQLSFNGSVFVEGNEISIAANGTLHASYKAQHGTNSVVANLDDETGHFEILLFEAYNQKGSNNLLSSSVSKSKEPINTNPHLKLYLLDRKTNELYLFEDKLPEGLNRLDAKNYSEGDSKKDAYWYFDIITTGTTQELVTDNNILQDLGLGNIHLKNVNSQITWTNPTTYYYTTQVGSSTVHVYSLPYVEYKYVNVKPQDSTWWASFKVAEHMRVGDITYYGNNVFTYRNLEVAFASGNRSVFLSTKQQGRMYDYTSTVPGIKAVGSSIVVSLLKKTLSSLPGASTFQTALGYINTIASANGTVTLGDSATNLNNNRTFAVGEKLDKYRFETSTNYNGSQNNGHYFTYHATLQYETNSNGSQNQIGALRVKFNVHNSSNSSSTPVSKDFQLNYTSTP